MRMTINKVDFAIEAVPGDLRAAVLAEPHLAPGLSRDIFEWDHETGKGNYLVQTLDNKAIPLGNALTFFVPKKGEGGALVNNDKLAKKTAKRFLETVGAKSPMGVLRSLARVLPLPRVGLPRKPFAELEKVASYRMALETEFSVVKLVEPSRNLSAYLLIPSQIGFRPQITKTDEAGYAKLIEAQPAYANMRPATVLPEGSKAQRDVRRLATAQRLRDTQPAIEAAKAAGEKPDPDTALVFARAVQEWRALTPQQKAS